mmetsp:Transcript_27410/g.40210  ORF Transcript_27410/g.40210 Transcript_27410/m.40210 type:complete len:203 (-) Transcript_27410:638-1246(-)
MQPRQVLCEDLLLPSLLLLLSLVLPIHPSLSSKSSLLLPLRNAAPRLLILKSPSLRHSCHSCWTKSTPRLLRSYQMEILGALFTPRSFRMKLCPRYLESERSLALYGNFIDGDSNVSWKRRLMKSMSFVMICSVKGIGQVVPRFDVADPGITTTATSTVKEEDVQLNCMHGLWLLHRVEQHLHSLISNNSTSNSTSNNNSIC